MASRLLSSLINGRHQINVRPGKVIMKNKNNKKYSHVVAGRQETFASIARDSKLFKEIVELMSKTSKMHMHVENLEVTKYHSCQPSRILRETRAFRIILPPKSAQGKSSSISHACRRISQNQENIAGEYRRITQKNVAEYRTLNSLSPVTPKYS